MSSERERLALRRELLVARASLQRLRIANHAQSLRRSLRGPGALIAAATSGPGRAVLFGLAMLVFGRGRMARVVKVAGVGLALAKVARTFLPRRNP
jgi:hypothetical protein